MSNPGVIILDHTQLNSEDINKSRFQVEDNIGEAIHIHVSDFRLDFTIDDFLILADGCRKALNSLLSDFGINSYFFDPCFLKHMQKHIMYLTGSEIRKFNLDDLRCIEYDPRPLRGWKPCKIVDSKTFECLQHNGRCADHAGECGGYTQNIDVLKKSVEKNGYPYNNQYIVMFERDLLIRDGKQRAAILRYLYGNIEIPVLILKFKRGYNKYKINRQFKVKAFLKYHLKTIIPVKSWRFLRGIYRRMVNKAAFAR